jgi:uncharacterized protein with HEPN domain
MSTRDDKAYLVDMLRAAEAMVEFVDDETEAQFRNDLKTQYATVRCIEIMSKAAGRLSSATRQKYKDVPWGKIKGMRNIVVHEYDQIDTAIVWSVATKHILPVIDELREILAKI